MTPIVKWTGGKTQLLDRLRPIAMRATRRYIEPFVGGGAVALSLPPEREVVVSDVEWELISTYETVRFKTLSVSDRLDRLARGHCKEQYYRVRAENPLWSTDRAARFIYLNKTCFNGLHRRNRDGHFNVPIGRGKKSSIPGMRQLLEFSRQTRNWRMLTGDFAEAVALARCGDVVFADPPYVGTHDYSSGFSIADQIRLRDALDEAWGRGATVATTNSSLALGIYRGGHWTIEEIAETRRVAADVGRRAAAPCLLMTRLR